MHPHLGRSCKEAVSIFKGTCGDARLPYDTADDRQQQLETVDGLDPLSEMRDIVHIWKGRRYKLVSSKCELADQKMHIIFIRRTIFRFPASGSMTGCILDQISRTDTERVMLPREIALDEFHSCAHLLPRCESVVSLCAPNLPNMASSLPRQAKPTPPEAGSGNCSCSLTGLFSSNFQKITEKQSRYSEIDHST